MPKTFKYQKIISQTYNAKEDEWEEDCEEIEYEVDDLHLLQEVTNCIYDEYLAGKIDESKRQIAKEIVSKFINDFDLLDEMVEVYENELYEVFEDEQNV